MNKKPTIYLAWTLIFLAYLNLLGGCMKNISKSKKISREETLKLNFVEGDVSSLDPHELASCNRGAALGKWLFEGLTRLNLKGEYELSGAKSVKVSPCKTRYTFTLRPNRYSDGTLVVASDYERCWKQAIAPNSKCLRAHFFYYIKNAEKAKKGEVPLEEVGVKALDDKTLVVELAHPTPYFLGLISATLFCPFKVERGTIISNGPYMATESRKDDYLDLERSPFFWDHDQIAIKKIKILMIRDEMTGLSLYKQKDLDWVGDPFNFLPPDVALLEQAQGVLFRGPEVTCPFWIYLNTKHPSLSSPLIRKALHLVLDREEIASHLFIGDDPLFTPLPSSSENFSCESDLIKGKELFEQGLKEVHLTKETFPTLKISSCNIVSFKRFAEYLKEKWEEAFGIQVDLDIKEWNTFYANIIKGAYQVGGFFVSCEYNDPVACLEMLAHSNNFSAWENHQYQQVIEKLKRESDLHVRSQLLKEAEDILKKEVPIIWVVNRGKYQGYRSDLKGVCVDHRGNPDFRFAYFE